MTEEEKEAIKYLKLIQQDFLKSAKQRRENGEDTGYGTLEDVDKLSAFEIGIILNLIQKQQEEIEENSKTIDNLIKEQKEREKYTHSLENVSEKKDKIINEMVVMLYHTGAGRRGFTCRFGRECNEYGCEICIRKYFESKV